LITRRALLIYNFGIALVFLLGGLLSVYVRDFVQPNRLVAAGVLASESREAIASEQELERLRAQALFYFDLSRDVRKARSQDAEQALREFRILALFVAALFALGGGLLILGAPKPSATLAAGNFERR